ncbi:hypothetical protein SKAU_G00113140 [Synaphobranchus kaupii]|uniref:Uncharacterized protein n=1 Tax=Synaphobranchus kaupii TaxID=118154 RepID=A0A9Q1G1Z4_SYNKA|nr:hypothetical protein SKAU_G00113140 [Synaphobranchus kaupii]
MSQQVDDDQALTGQGPNVTVPLPTAQCHPQRGLALRPTSRETGLGSQVAGILSEKAALFPPFLPHKQLMKERSAAFGAFVLAVLVPLTEWWRCRVPHPPSRVENELPQHDRAPGPLETFSPFQGTGLQAVRQGRMQSQCFCCCCKPGVEKEDKPLRPVSEEEQPSGRSGEREASRPFIGPALSGLHQRPRTGGEGRSVTSRGERFMARRLHHVQMKPECVSPWERRFNCQRVDFQPRRPYWISKIQQSPVNPPPLNPKGLLKSEYRTPAPITEVHAT